LIYKSVIKDTINEHKSYFFFFFLSNFVNDKNYRLLIIVLTTFKLKNDRNYDSNYKLWYKIIIIIIFLISIK